MREVSRGTPKFTVEYEHPDWRRAVHYVGLIQVLEKDLDYFVRKKIHDSGLLIVSADLLDIVSVSFVSMATEQRPVTLPSSYTNISQCLVQKVCISNELAQII